MEWNSNSVEWKEIAIMKLLFPSTPFISEWKEIAIFRINIKVEGNSNFKITTSFHSSIFGMEGQKMEWKEIATPLWTIIITLGKKHCFLK